MVALSVAHGLLFPPGSAFSYSNINYVVADITRFNPSFFWASGALVSNVDDLDRFYDALFEGAANGTIQSLVESLQARVTVLRAASLSQPGRAAQTVEEVRAIVEALERRDGDAAAAACVHHVNEAARTVFEAMAAEAEV